MLSLLTDTATPLLLTTATPCQYDKLDVMKQLIPSSSFGDKMLWRRIEVPIETRCYGRKWKSRRVEECETNRIREYENRRIREYENRRIREYENRRIREYENRRIGE